MFVPPESFSHFPQYEKPFSTAVIPFSILFFPCELFASVQPTTVFALLPNSTMATFRWAFSLASSVSFSTKFLAASFTL